MESFTDGNPDYEDDYEYEEKDNGHPPQLTQSAVYKYQVEAFVPNALRKFFENISVFWGRQVAMGNSPRKENPRHLNQIEMINNYAQEDMVLLADRGYNIAASYVAETTMERGNEKTGGFEREMQQSVFRNESATIKQTQHVPMTEEKKRFLSRFRKNKEES